MKRRSFFKSLVRAFFSICGAALFGYPVLKFVSHKKEAEKPVIFRQEETLQKISYKPEVYLLRRDDDFHAISARCTHLGCTVAFDQGKKEFHCPCHGSTFDQNGSRLSGPAGKPLPRLSVKREKNNDLVVMMDG